MLRHLLSAITCCLLAFSYSFAQDETNVTGVEKVDKYLDSLTKNYGFNGVALLAQNGKILLQKGYGWKDVKSKTLNDSTSIFQIGSITKQFTAAIILKLEEEGKLSVNDKLNKFFPGYPNGDKITIHHLLTHSAGIYDYVNNLPPYKFILKKTMSRQKIVSSFENKSLAFEPGTQFSYSNSGYFLLGMIIEKLTGKPYEEVIRETIFLPTGMTHSGFDFRNLKDTSRTTGYSVFYNGRQTKAFDMDSTVLFSAGGIYSTVADLYKWVKAVSAKQIIAANSWEKALTPYIGNYGYGWAIDSLYSKKYITHGGNTSNFKAQVIYFPDQDLTLILFCNTAGDLWNNCITILQSVFNQTNAWGNNTAISVAEPLLQDFKGTYEYDGKKHFFITVSGGKLFVSEAPSTFNLNYPVVPLSDTQFYDTRFNSWLEFVSNSTGKTTALIFRRQGFRYHTKKIAE